jgi:outer membrane lipoprotein-sorting protein
MLGKICSNHLVVKALMLLPCAIFILHGNAHGTNKTAVPVRLPGPGEPAEGTANQQTAAMAALSPGEVLDRMARAYSSCKSYKDRGVVTTVFFHDVRGKSTTKQPFTTAFVRPNRFRFEFQRRPGEEGSNRYIVWRDGYSVRTWWAVGPGLESNESFVRAIAGMTGVSSGSAHTIPRLLLHVGAGGRRSLAHLTDLELLEGENSGGVPCFKIQGRFPGGEMRTLWIDEKNYMIRKIFESCKFADFRTETTTTYDSRFNVDVGPDDLKFGPPQDARPTTPPTVRFAVPARNLEMRGGMQVCAANLQKIYAAIKGFEKDKGMLPNWLSDLVPDYLSKDILLCPNDMAHRSGRAPDPELPCSYSYQFSSARSMSGWVYRDYKERQVKELGSHVPIVRCRNHGAGVALSLSVGGRIYWSPGTWERTIRPVPPEDPEADN